MLLNKILAATFVVAGCSTSPEPETATEQPNTLHRANQEISQATAMPDSDEQKVPSKGPTITRVFWFFGDHGP
jgi:hypothetical protein